jgi:hypothetical protein
VSRMNATMLNFRKQRVQNVSRFRQFREWAHAADFDSLIIWIFA